MGKGGGGERLGGRKGDGVKGRRWEVEGGGRGREAKVYYSGDEVVERWKAG